MHRRTLYCSFAYQVNCYITSLSIFACYFNLLSLLRAPLHRVTGIAARHGGGMQPTPGRNRYASLTSPDHNATTSTSMKNKAVSPTTHQTQPKNQNSPPVSHHHHHLYQSIKYKLKKIKVPLINNIDTNRTLGTTDSPPNIQLATIIQFLLPAPPNFLPKCNRTN